VAGTKRALRPRNPGKIPCGAITFQVPTCTSVRAWHLGQQTNNQKETPGAAASRDPRGHREDRVVRQRRSRPRSTRGLSEATGQACFCQDPSSRIQPHDSRSRATKGEESCRPRTPRGLECRSPPRSKLVGSRAGTGSTAALLETSGGQSARTALHDLPASTNAKQTCCRPRSARARVHSSSTCTPATTR